MCLESRIALAGNIEFTVKYVRSDKGFIRYDVCSEKTFLSEKCEFSGSIEATRGDVVVKNIQVPDGKWAVQLFHDEKNIGHMETGMFGIPKDGTAFSRDATGHYGPPRYADAEVEVKGDTNLVLHMVY